MRLGPEKDPDWQTHFKLETEAGVYEESVEQTEHEKAWGVVRAVHRTDQDVMLGSVKECCVSRVGSWARNEAGG